MATNVKGAEGTKPEAVDLEAVKAQAVADYKNRVASMESVFAGLEISAEDKKQFIDGNKSVADATAFALAKAKENIAALAEDLKKVSAERDGFKAKAENKPAATSEKSSVIAALAASAAAQNSVQGGVAATESPNDKLLKEAYAAGAKAFK